MNAQHYATIAFFLGASVIPIVSEYKFNKGFDILIYEPFDFAYFLLVTAAFILINRFFKQETAILHGALISLLWFFVTFLAVGQLHLSMGRPL